MKEQLRSPSPRLSSGAKDATTIRKVETTTSSIEESDGETTASMTSSEEGSSPANVRNVSATQTRGKRVSRTSITRPEGFSPVKRVSKTLPPCGTSNKQSRVIKSVSENNTATKRTSGASKRSSGSWDTLARKSASFQNNNNAGVGGSRTSINKGHGGASKWSATSNTATPKDKLIVKLKKQVEMLQEHQKKTDISHKKTSQNLEVKLDDLRVADSILIDQLRSERNELKEQLEQSKDRIQSIGEEQEDAMQKELAAKRGLEHQLAEAHARIRKLSEAAMDDHIGGGDTNNNNKIDTLRERRRAIEAQMSSQGAVPRNNKNGENMRPQNTTDVDMEAVIKNLKDELEASKQVIVQQKEQLRMVFESQDGNNKNEKETTTDDESTWKSRFLAIQKRHLQLECDRAWSEFQLRNRITNDRLKFNRRLNHWKGQVQDLETKFNMLETVRATRRVSKSQQEEAVPQLAPVDDSSGGGKSTEEPPQRGWFGFRK
ncbi:MAG: hypothetical protein SGBAC_007110 [Bacillariaceae sp.]